MWHLFSRYAFAVPFKDKRGPKVADAFQRIFGERVPNILRNNSGLEFLNTHVQSIFRKHDVHHCFSLKDDVKAGLVQQFNRTLKSWLYRCMSHSPSYESMD
jgi:hypothetical protein